MCDDVTQGIEKIAAGLLKKIAARAIEKIAAGLLKKSLQAY